MLVAQHTQRQIKYLLDRFVAALLLLAATPLFALIALAIKLDDGGPIFFTQTRSGLNGKHFTIWKFRTMIVNADQRLRQDGSVGDQNRITRVGRFLRYLSLDEIAQLINILKGEMSFIGPRPVLLSHVQRFTEEQKQRLQMKPGVTGLAQIHGRNTLKWSRRIAYDIEYINRYSLWLDLTIILRTGRVVLLGEGIVLDRNPEQVDDLAPLAGQLEQQN